MMNKCSLGCVVLNNGTFSRVMKALMVLENI